MFSKKNIIIISVLTSFVFYAIILFYSDTSKIIEHIQKIDPILYLISFLLITSSIAIRGIRFFIIMRSLGILISLKECIIIFTSGLAFSLTPGGIGTGIKSLILKNKYEKSFSSTVPVMIFEKWLEISTNILIIGILLIWFDYTASKIIFLIGSILCAFSIIIFKKQSGIMLLNSLAQRLWLFKKFSLNHEEFKKTSSMLFSPKNLLNTLSITILNNFIVLVAIFLIFQSSYTQITLFESGQLYYTSITLGILSLIPGGIVITEGGLLGLLLNHGIEITTASFLVLSIRFQTFWYTTILGFISLRWSIYSKINSKL